MKNNFKKIITLILILIVFIQPVFVYANEPLPEGVGDPTNFPSLLPPVDGAGGGPITPVPIRNTPVTVNASLNQLNSLTPNFVDSQIQQSIGRVSATSTQVQPTNGAVTGAASCFGSQVISQAIVQQVNQFASNLAGRVSDTIFNVPVAESGQTGAAIKADAAARIGSGLPLFGFSIPGLPSWDAMAYCIVNTMIIYIADSTIQWINTGFEGNPAFLNNPDQFFIDLANQEKINFIQNLAYGANSAVCGINKSNLVSAVLSRYQANQQRIMTGQMGYQTGGYMNGMYGNGAANNMCPFDNQQGKLNLFFGGNFAEGGGWDTWFQITQNPMHNPYDLYFNTNAQLDAQVQAVKISKERELTWNNGYLSFRTCKNGEKDTSKCPITTPGSVIQNQLETTLNLGKNRLVLAQKFDQVVTAVVDQLIATALDKVLDRESYRPSAYRQNLVNPNLWNSTSTDFFRNLNQNNNSSTTNSVNLIN